MNQDQILRSYESSLRMSIPLAFASSHERVVDLDESIESLATKLASC